MAVILVPFISGLHPIMGLGRDSCPWTSIVSTCLQREALTAFAPDHLFQDEYSEHPWKTVSDSVSLQNKEQT